MHYRRRDDLSSIALFAKKYLGFENWWHHYLIYYILEDILVQDKETGKLNFNIYLHKKNSFKPQGVLVKKHKTNRLIQILAPRYHAKSSCITFVYPLFLICNNPNIRILIVSANEDLASSYVRQIQTQLENNDLIKQDFGGLRPKKDKKWGEKAFIVERDTIEKDPTISSAGLMGKIISKRADVVILDDVIDLERARTEGQRQKVLDWYERVVYPILTPTSSKKTPSKLIVVGTKWFKGDLYDVIETEKDFDVKLKLKAIIYDRAKFKKGTLDSDNLNMRDEAAPDKEPLSFDVNTIFNKGIKKHFSTFGLNQSLEDGSLWTPMWNFEKIMKAKKDMSPSAFYSQFMNEPVSTFETFLKKEWVDAAFKRGRGIQLPQSWDNIEYNYTFPHVQLTVIMGVDLSATETEKRKADKTAITIWGLSQNGDRYLLHIEEFNASLAQTKQKVIDLFYLYNPIKVVVESNVFQDFFRQDLADDIPIEGLKTTAFNKFDQTKGLAHLETLFSQGKIIIPNHSGKTSGDRIIFLNKFYQELTTFTRDAHVPDMIMASWMALTSLMEYDVLTRQTGGYINQSLLANQLKKITNPSRLVVSRDGTRINYSYNSIFCVFAQKFEYLKENQPLFVFASYLEGRALAYFFNKETAELVAKIDGAISPIFFADMLFNILTKVNNPQVGVLLDTQGGGSTILFQLQNKRYSNIYCGYPDENNLLKFEKGVPYKSYLLSGAFEYLLWSMHKKYLIIKDKSTINDLAKIISVNMENIITTDNKTPTRSITFALGYYLLQNFNKEKKENKEKKKKERKIFDKPHYTIFNYN